MTITSTYSDGTPRVTYHVRTAAGTVLAQRQADHAFYAASTVKLAVMVAVYRLAHDGTLTFQDELTSTDTFVSQIVGAPSYQLVPDDVDHGMPAPGQPISIAELVERMIVVSSNEATNILVDHIGLAAVNQVFADAGAGPDTVMGRKFGDFAAADAHGPANFVTAAGLAALMGALVAGDLATAESTADMLAVLGRQTGRVLTADLPDNRRWGSKDGSVTGIRHDVAFFGEPGPDAVVIAVCTNGYDETDANEVITAIGRLTAELTGEG